MKIRALTQATNLFFEFLSLTFLLPFLKTKDEDEVSLKEELMVPVFLLSALVTPE